MLIYPAIDLRAGRVVRLVRGRADAQTTYADDPAAVASTWVRQGAEWIHVVDLDGAFAGRSRQGDLLERLAAIPGIRIQFGGGLRTIEEVERALDRGAARVVLGSAAVNDPDLLRTCIARYGARVAVAVDVGGGAVRTGGWQEASCRAPVEYALWLEQAGVARVVVTDVGRDGTLLGPNLELTGGIAAATGLSVIASGGVSALGDLRALAGLRAEGAIVGKALYERRFTLSEALQACKEDPDAG